MSSSSSFSGHVDARFADDLGDPNAVTITIDLPDPVGAKTMQRAADEPVEKALTRLRATIASGWTVPAAKERQFDRASVARCGVSGKSSIGMDVPEGEELGTSRMRK